MKQVPVAVGVIKNNQGQVLISLRDAALHQGGLWEFPGGKIETGETAQQALVRELKEELGITALTATPLLTVQHQYPDVAVTLHVFLVTDFSGQPNSTAGQAIQWVYPDALANYDFPAANRPIVTAARLPPYYAILDDTDEMPLLRKLHKILARGIKLIQLRLKNLPPLQVQAFIEQAHPLCQQQHAVLLINSGSNGAQHFAVDGLHLSSQHLLALHQRPAPPLGNPQPRFWVAASCHNLEELQHAQNIGVDFAVLAPVLPTKTHPDATPLGWAQFTELVSQVNLPVYALGGLVEADLSLAQQAGAQGISAIRAFL
ncbi:MAG: Nudix family hydrolase [Methylococcales bacterium]|nr:Nudix family hydrolase [Methylococcales bacterium]